MNILIAGGSGFLGRALTDRLTSAGHTVFVLTRQTPRSARQIQWDAKTLGGWAGRIEEMDAVIHLTGYGLDHWPWTQRQKKRFIDSRVIPGLVLAEAFEKATRRPVIFLQTSGINRYGLRGESAADESTPAADDFPAQLTVIWENATQAIEELGVRRIITRNAPVLARRGGLFSLMALPARLFFGGNLGDGTNSLNWIHLTDYTRAIQFLLEHESAHGPFNLIAPTQTTGADFMQSTARAFRRPYWFHLPTWLLRIPLGEMHIMLTEGRYAQPKHLLELGFQFQYPELDLALKDLLN
jgi:uncharacterized protein (TIGR01777 family)